MSSNIKTAYALADDNLVAFYFHNYVLNSMITFFWRGWVLVSVKYEAQAQFDRFRLYKTSTFR